MLTKDERKYVYYDIKAIKRMCKQNPNIVMVFGNRYKSKKGANMITKEKYQKERIRMWDSLRETKYKGYETCSGVACVECALQGVCSSFTPFESIEAIEKWSKEHPEKVKKSEFFNSFDEVMCLFAFGKIDSSDLISIERWYYGSTKYRWKVTYFGFEK